MAKSYLFVNWRVYVIALIAYSGVFVFGFDTGVTGGVLALQGFQDDFLGGQTASTDVMSMVVSVLQAGSFFGALIAAPLSEYFGRRNSLVITSIIFAVGAAIQTAATTNIAYIYGGRTVAGFGVGAMTMLAPTYVSEAAPANIRGRVTGLFQVVVVTGVAMSYWITYGVNLHMPPSHAQWRIPLGFQFVPVGIMLLFLPFCRESPRWLARKGKVERCLLNLAWMRNTSVNDLRLQDEFAGILASVKEEREITGNWRECFKRGNRIRFGISSILFLLQQFCGQNSISYYCPEIFQSIGISSADSALFASGIYGLVKIAATGLFLWLGIEQFGRRNSLMYGVLSMGVLFFIIGALLSTHPPVVGGPVSNWSIGMAVCIYVYLVPYSFSVGPVPWVYCSEIWGNNVLRSYGVAFAAASQWLFNFVVSKLTPMFESKLTNGTLFFMFGAINVLTAVFCFFLPETRDVTLEEMDILFGYVSPEKRRHDVEQVSFNLQHGALSGPDRGQHLFEEHDMHMSQFTEEHDMETLSNADSYEKALASRRAVAL